MTLLLSFFLLHLSLTCTCLGVLCCFALFVCLTLLASFFHLSFKNMYNVYIHACIHVHVLCTSHVVQDVKHDVEVSQSEREEEILARREAEATLRNTRKEMEAQELVRDKVVHVPSVLYIT